MRCLWFDQNIQYLIIDIILIKTFCGTIALLISYGLIQWDCVIKPHTLASLYLKER